MEPQVATTKRSESLQPAPGLPWLGWAILLLTALMSATWSMHKLLEQDEIFSLQTDRVTSLAEVLRIQRFYPISLEPPPYHVLAHAAMNVFGPSAFALRLPALFGYLLMQFCLYFFVRNLVGDRLTGRRAGLIAMALPALTWTLYYSAEGRPYGVLLGSYAAAALCWQIAARRGDLDHPRFWPLVGLAASLALTLNVHFYGVLLPIAICGAEFARTASRRRLDTGMLAAIGLGIASLAATLPYIKASSEFKKHYYAGPVSAHLLTQPYRQMLMDYTTYPKPVQAALVLLLSLAAAFVLWSCIRIARRKQIAASTSEWALIILLALMPVFAFLLGKTVTHALEVRHSIGAIVAISSLFAIALSPVLRQQRVFSTVITVMLVSIVLINTLRIRTSAADDRATLDALTITPALTTAIDLNPDRNIYFQDLGRWETASLYEPDPALRSRLVLVYSRSEEMDHERHDTMYLTATHTQKFSPQPIVSYDDLRRTPGDHIFATYHTGWDWTDAAFAIEAAQVQPLGPGFGGDVVRVRFKQ
jgi:4-amino-4-deoxy-L-arabinose transferase-like glycosyltransferase